MNTTKANYLPVDLTHAGKHADGTPLRVCVDCQHAVRKYTYENSIIGIPYYECMKAPINRDPVTGDINSQPCREINTDGRCPMWEAQMENVEEVSPQEFKWRVEKDVSRSLAILGIVFLIWAGIGYCAGLISAKSAVSFMQSGLGIEVASLTNMALSWWQRRRDGNSN